MTDDDGEWRRQPAFDQSRYDLLDRETGGAAGAVLAVYGNALAPRRVGMLQAIAAGEVKELGRMAHTLKSGSLSLGLLRLGALCEMIERRAASGTLMLMGLDQILRATFDEATAAVEGLRQEH